MELFLKTCCVEGHALSITSEAHMLNTWADAETRSKEQTPPILGYRPSGLGALKALDLPLDTEELGLWVVRGIQEVIVPELVPRRVQTRAARASPQHFV
mmetsp:Transcript_93885/g.265215  ORF Transcript_93885/g.265215 Transcript_93885/m.265215 type:complete len:99 (-) Transcript_93885:467-763(-)